MFDRVNPNNCQSMKQSRCDDGVVDDGFGIGPTLLMKSRTFHPDVKISHFCNENTMKAFSGTESNSDYILRLVVWAFFIMSALFSGAFQIIFILGYIYEY